MIRSALLTALLVLSGCVPVRYTNQIVPHITGTLTAGDSPVVGARVWQIEQTRADSTTIASAPSAGLCALAPSGTVSVTDAAGAFSLPGRSERQWGVLPLFAAPLFVWDLTLCVQEDERPALPWQTREYGRMPVQVELACDVGGVPALSCRVLSPVGAEAVPGR